MHDHNPATSLDQHKTIMIVHFPTGKLLSEPGEMKPESLAHLHAMVATKTQERTMDLPRSAGADVKFTILDILPGAFIVLCLTIIKHEAPASVEPSLN